MGKNTGKGKGKHLRVVGKEDRLTEKQEAFCQLVAKGKMLAEAYREAGYMPNGSDKTQWEAASRLMSSNSKVIARVKALQADMEQDRRTIERRREEWVLKRLTQEADQAETDGARIRQSNWWAGPSACSLTGSNRQTTLSGAHPISKRIYGSGWTD